MLETGHYIKDILTRSQKPLKFTYLEKPAGQDGWLLRCDASRRQRGTSDARLLRTSP